MKRIAVTIIVLFLTVMSSGQGTILFRPDYSAAAWPVAGWDRAISELFGVRWTRTYLPTGGPFGGPAHRLSEIATPSASGCGGQHGWGWDVSVGNDPPRGPAGRRYYRWAMRYTAASNFMGANPETGCPAASTSDKLLIIGQGCNTQNCRVIITVKVRTDRMMQFGVAIDGGLHQTENDYRTNITQNPWLWIQLEVTPSSSTTTFDGGWRLFVNNNTTPELVRTGIRLDPDNHNFVGLGNYNNNALRSGGTHEFDLAFFEVATALDPNWYRTSSTILPAMPTSIRIAE